MSRFMDPRLQVLTPYTPGEQPRDRKLIKLNTNESPYPPSPNVFRAISRDAVEDLRLYSDTTAEALTRAIARRYGLDPAQVVVGNGSDEILAFAFLTFCGEKGAAFPDITYGFYPVFAELFGAKVRIVPLKEDFSIDVQDYRKPGEMAVIANPNAPTGLCLPLEKIEAVLRAHPDDVVLIDEAYVDFGAKSAAALIPQYPNLLVVQTFSKSRSLAGSRIGFALGSAELIGDLQTVRRSFNPYNVDRLAQLAGTAAMEDEAYFRACTGRIMATRARTAEALKKMGCTLTDSMGNFLFVRLPGVPGVEAQRRFREKGILIRRFDVPRIADYLRVTIGSEQEMEAFVRAAAEIIEEGKA